MPQKLGNGGHSQEAYDPSTGKYVEDGKENKYYNNPGEYISSSPVTDIQMDFLRNFLKNKEKPVVKKEEPVVEIKEKNEVDEEFKQNFRQKFKTIYQKNNPKLFNDMIETLENMDENSFNLFIQASNFVESTNQTKGEGQFSRWDRNIHLDYRQLENGDFSCYTRNGVLFHEMGHAIDNMLTLNFGKEPRYSRQYISSLYVSEKHGMSLEQALFQELKEIDTDKLREREKNDFSLKEKEDEIKMYDEIMKEENIKAKLNFGKNVLGIDLSSYKNNEYNVEINERGNLVYYKKFQDGSFFQTHITGFANEPEKLKEFKRISDAINLFEIDYGESTQGKYKELKEKKVNLEKDKYHRMKKWGDMSDVMQGLTGRKLDNGMGHKSNYFSSPEVVAKECFAELYESKTTNQESYDLFKEYFPKAVDVFEEIISHFGGKNGK